MKTTRLLLKFSGEGFQECKEQFSLGQDSRGFSASLLTQVFAVFEFLFTFTSSPRFKLKTILPSFRQ